MSGYPPSLDHLPAAVVFTKPLIILIDEFSISAADIFPSMMQDNARGILVGMRTSGGGGSVSSYYAGFYSEGTASNTNSLVVRKEPVVTEEYPAAPFVENIGARPDIKLDYMKRENLMDGGRTFVSEFTGIILNQIRNGGR
jgi:C-terminal processing protease CtpA/Prc